MNVRNILVLATEPLDEDIVRSAILGDVEGQARVHVVAPATHLSAAQRLANDEDEARREAEGVALRTKAAFESSADVDFEVGDADPLLAVEDALRMFPADEIVVVSAREEDGVLGGEHAFGRFGVPVRRISLRPTDVDRSRVREGMREFARGRRESTPFIAFFGVNALLLALAALISLVVLLVLWLS